MALISDVTKLALKSCYGKKKRKGNGVLGHLPMLFHFSAKRCSAPYTAEDLAVTLGAIELSGYRRYDNALDKCTVVLTAVAEVYVCR